MGHMKHQAHSMNEVIFLIGLIAGTVASASSDSRNIWHNPSSLDSPLEDIQWCGDNASNDQGAILLTNKGNIYISSDRGVTWERKSDAFTRASLNARMDLNRNAGIVSSIISNPIDTNEMIFVGNDGMNWITTDCGQTIKTLDTKLNLKEFQFHASNRNWMLASSWSTCPKNSPSSACAITKDLYLSQDKGKSWNQITKYIVQFAWAKKKSSQFNVPEERIVFSRELGNQSHQRIQGWNMKTHLYFSDDFLKSSTMIVNQGNKFLLTESFLFAAQVHKSEDKLVKLMVAQANSKEYSFAEAQIPQELTQHSFTILDTSEGQVFLNINHLGPNSPLGTIYQSDSTGTRFSVTLHDNVRSADAQCDFEKVNGVEGIYISNVYTGKKTIDVKNRLKSYDPDSSNDDIPTEHTKNKKSTSDSLVSASNTLKDNTKLLSDTIVSMITFDKGGSWQHLRPPAKDSLGNPISCEWSKKCSLHLHSVSSQLQFGPVYSSDNSVGIIVATGNTGQNLSMKAGRVNTYLSRDAGLSWEEIKKGSHIYEIADHGSLILLANDQKPTTDVHYSWDEGRTWNKKQISDKPIQISNIITEPGNTSDKFLVYGSAEGDNDLNGIIVLVDFNQLHPRECTGFTNTGTQDSDYEIFIPHNPNEICLLGREMKYVRRKRDAGCFNPENFERPVHVTRCECTEADWECDVGFQRSENEESFECIPHKGYKVSYDPPSTCENYFTVSQGYRKTVGNQCLNGVNHSAIKIPCPMFGFLSFNGLFTNLMIILGMFGLFYLIISCKDKILLFIITHNLDQSFQEFVSCLQSWIFISKLYMPWRTINEEDYGQQIWYKIDEENGLKVDENGALLFEENEYYTNNGENEWENPIEDEEEEAQANIDAVAKYIAATECENAEEDAKESDQPSNSVQESEAPDLLEIEHEIDVDEEDEDDFSQHDDPFDQV